MSEHEHFFPVSTSFSKVNKPSEPLLDSAPPPVLFIPKAVHRIGPSGSESGKGHDQKSGTKRD